jgi:trigger factor
MKKGEQGTVKVTFPDPYHAKELAGKPAGFKITLRSMKVMNLPEITAEFIKKIGIASGEESELRAELEKHLQRQADEAIFNKLKKNTLKNLQEANPIDLPESLINQNILQLQQEEMRRHAERNGGNLPDDYQPDRNLYIKHVTEQTHMGILIMKLAEQEKIEVSQQDLEEKIRDMAASYEKPNDLLQHYANNREAVMQLRQNILEDKAIQWIVDHATVTDKEVSFEEAIAQDKE